MAKSNWYVCVLLNFRLLQIYSLYSSKKAAAKLSRAKKDYFANLFNVDWQERLELFDSLTGKTLELWKPQLILIYSLMIEYNNKSRDNKFINLKLFHFLHTLGSRFRFEAKSRFKLKYFCVHVSHFGPHRDCLNFVTNQIRQVRGTALLPYCPDTSTCDVIDQSIKWFMHLMPAIWKQLN